jgi:hypothetical protein
MVSELYSATSVTGPTSWVSAGSVDADEPHTSSLRDAGAGLPQAWVLPAGLVDDRQPRGMTHREVRESPPVGQGEGLHGNPLLAGTSACAGRTPDPLLPSYTRCQQSTRATGTAITTSARRSSNPVDLGIRRHDPNRSACGMLACHWWRWSGDGWSLSRCRRVHASCPPAPSQPAPP